MPNEVEIAKKLRDSDVWNFEECGALCYAVGLGKAWDDATAEDFEEIVVRAGKLIGIEIL